MTILHNVAALFVISAALTCSGGPDAPLPICSERGASPARYERSRLHMGTSFRIILYASGREAAMRAFDGAFLRIKRLDEVLSNYDSASELNHLCHGGPHSRPIEVSDDLWKVLERSETLAAITQDTLDISIGPLTKLWRRARRRKTLPTFEQMREARERAGLHHIKLYRESRRVQILRAGMQLDLGAIAKGYAADEALREIQRLGITQASVDAGGDLALGDPPPEQVGWTVAIPTLDPASQIEKESRPADQTFLRLANVGIATSGDSRQFVEIDGTRYSHIIDPRTGLGLTRRISVTVISADCMTADGLASAACVLGLSAGMKTIEPMGEASAMFQVMRNGHNQQYTTRGFSRFVVGHTTASQMYDCTEIK